MTLGRKNPMVMFMLMVLLDHKGPDVHVDDLPGPDVLIDME